MNIDKKISWESSLDSLSKSKFIKNLEASEIKTLNDLLWLLPLRRETIPPLKPFNLITNNTLFLGEGEVISARFNPAFGRRGKGKIQLFNGNMVLKDTLSPSYVNLKWFNLYPNQLKTLKELTKITFLGTSKELGGSFEFINPIINPKTESGHELTEYPTRNKVPGKFIESLLKKIPEELWDEKKEVLPDEILKKRNLPSLQDSFLKLHGKKNKIPFQNALNRLIYEDFFNSALKIFARKEAQKLIIAESFSFNDFEMNKLIKLFPYELTPDQLNVMNEIKDDLKKGHPMMRLIQGDVGCGKTSIALIASLLINQKNKQVAFMCPTETLARQHFETFKKFYQNTPYKLNLLVGSMSLKEKKEIYQKLKTGEINLLIGTHTLFQEKISFHELSLVIIDEQHKFGVNQRLKLVSKGNAPHTLLMSATPIPRTLQMAQYGDLDISSIRTMPLGRKPIKTRIVKKENYIKFLSFLKTRVELKEQVYIVVPAIEESEEIEITNIEKLFKFYKNTFALLKIATLHGKLDTEIKTKTINEFSKGKIDILLSTSVIEVGIDVPNATVMAIYDPNRFGLSSLHQLRGRVGRGGKAGFCFLVVQDDMSEEAQARLKIVEDTTDGFKIAEADLKNRGSGDLFGKEQSGHVSSHKIGNIFEHFELFEAVNKDIKMIKKNYPDIFEKQINQLIKNEKIRSTI